MSASRAVFGIVFALVMLLQLQVWGLPIAEPDPNPTLETMFNPLINTIWGVVAYMMRALIPAVIAGVLVRRW